MSHYTEEAKAIFPEAREVRMEIVLDGETVGRMVTQADLRLDYAVFAARFVKPMLQVLNAKWSE